MVKLAKGIVDGTVGMNMADLDRLIRLEAFPRDQPDSWQEIVIADLRGKSREELRESLRAAVDELPPHYRIVLVLRDMEELDTREVAQALDLAESTVKMRLHRARLLVRQKLEERLRA